MRCGWRGVASPDVLTSIKVEFLPSISILFIQMGLLNFVCKFSV